MVDNEDATPAQNQPGTSSASFAPATSISTSVVPTAQSAATTSSNDSNSAATALFKAFHVYHFIQTVTNAANQLGSALDSFSTAQVPFQTADSQLATPAAYKQQNMTTGAFPAVEQPMPTLEIPALLQTAPCSAPPRITPPVTPPNSVDVSVSAVLAQLSAKVSENLVSSGLNPGTTQNSAPQTPQLATSVCPAAELASPAYFNAAATPQKRKQDPLSTVLERTDCASPVDSLPSGLKRLKVKVLQGSAENEPLEGQNSASGKETAIMNLASRLATESTTSPQDGSEGSPAAAPASPQPQMRRTGRGKKRTAGPAADTCQREHRPGGCWSDGEKQLLIKIVTEMHPCGAADWETVASKLNALRNDGTQRKGPSAERMYRTLTDPSYSRTANPHGRRLNPRKGTTPMHVMATYSLQQLPDNEGNLSQITELIAANERFASELDWTPRPGTKTYPRWKDALVGCFKPGRYPHLIKTDRKRDGLTVYKLLLDKLAEPARHQAPKPSPSLQPPNGARFGLA
uniref:Myb-like domain-containing protein n=1 Tax=Tetraselmis sp. GSL018 TaxID=582737 RepID=A0A061R5K4_9CHLO|mmetsp:Transcript_34246/g.81222  ORF Transcript_34246/g.81222 Transcript_34246/m.81222 type:complete len:517 (-) Transcript_34246:261-1811(-)